MEHLTYARMISKNRRWPAPYENWSCRNGEIRTRGNPRYETTPGKYHCIDGGPKRLHGGELAHAQINEWDVLTYIGPYIPF